MRLSLNTTHLQLLYAPEWTRTTTSHEAHKALNLIRRCHIRPPASGWADTSEFAGIERNDLCQRCVTESRSNATRRRRERVHEVGGRHAKLFGQSRSGCGSRSPRDFDRKGRVIMPPDGGGIDPTVPASSGVQPTGGQLAANTHVIREPGCAALGAMIPAEPSRQSCSPTGW